MAFRCNFQSEVVSDVISGASGGHTDTDKPVKYDDSSSNGS